MESGLYIYELVPVVCMHKQRCLVSTRSKYNSLTTSTSELICIDVPTYIINKILQIQNRFRCIINETKEE